MRCFALRLAIALLTFVVGVTVAALWYSGSTDGLEKVVTPPPPPRLVAYQPRTTELPPPPPAPHTDVPTKTMVVGGVLNAKAISKPVPAYPPIAKAARAQGTVVVEIVIGESGDVISANVVSGHPLLQQAAVAAARQAKFSPTRLSGQPVQVSGTLTYNFVLE
jgi:TonB family protein